MASAAEASARQQAYYSCLGNQESLHGLTSGALNFFLASGGEGCLPQQMGCGTYRGSVTSHQPVSAPVYGPSRTPILPQFVDLATNTGRMSPFFSLGNYALFDDDACKAMSTTEGVEEDAHAVHHKRASILLNTPQQQQQMMTGTLTPSSAMGMTVSPSTTCRNVTQVTPCATLCVEARMRTLPRKANSVASVATTTTTAGAITMATASGHPTSLATELDSAFEEHRREKKAEATSQLRDEMTLGAGEAESTQSCGENPPDGKQQASHTGPEQRTTQRRSKDQRRGKVKNGSQQQSRRHNNNNSTNRALVASSRVSVGNNQLPEDGKRYFLSLRCHGERSTTALSCMEFRAGDHVIFEGDRGVDLGAVTNSEEVTGGVESGDRGVLCVLRRATEEEVEEWKGSLVADEEEAAMECRAACEELGLTIRIAAAVFQFDRQKLTFFYESSERVDFRLLLQVMFSKYRCRIWLERIDSAS